MTTRHSRFDLPKRHPHPESEEKRRASPRALLTGDPLTRLMSLHPLIVGLMFLVLGWGSLLLIAWRLEVITSVFLRSPAFMVGDLVLLPLATAFMASFYRSASIKIPRESGVGITIASALIAAIAAGTTAAFSIFLSETYHGHMVSAPHPFHRTLRLRLRVLPTTCFLRNCLRLQDKEDLPHCPGNTPTDGPHHAQVLPRRLPPVGAVREPSSPCLLLYKGGQC